MAYGSKVNKKARLMKDNQDGGAYAAKNPAAPAKELMNNQSKVAKAGCRLKQVSNGSKIAKMGNPYNSNISQEAQGISPFPMTPMGVVPKFKEITAEEKREKIEKKKKKRKIFKKKS